MKSRIESDAEKHRRSIRLKYRDYALPGLYFVTLCAHEKRCDFGRIMGARLAPSELGQLAGNWIERIHDWTNIEKRSGRSSAAPLQLLGWEWSAIIGGDLRAT